MPRALLDLGDPEAAVRALWEIPFDVLINPAGLTGLEECEDDPELARRANVLGPAALARHCRDEGARMIHFSTDYVFDGKSPGLKSEEDLTSPLSIYGMTKHEGELAVLEAGGTVVRVAWVFGPEKAAFPDQLLADALAGRPLGAVADKFSLPTYTRDLAEWIAALIGRVGTSGLFHACNSGEPVSWHGMAEEIVSFLTDRGLLEPGVTVRPLSVMDLPSLRAPRPIHTAMATDQLVAVLGVEPRDWRVALHDHLKSSLDLE
ncbi:MAG: nad(p)-binding domain [Akkermansiaceae bacterium]|nr:nad(p)-binding domain [Akkermansiaceae bacterium]